MQTVLFSGYYGFRNLGDEAILAASLAAFRRLRPDLRFQVLSGNPADTMRRHGVEAIPRLRFAGAVANADLVLSGGGGLLQDATSVRSLAYYLAVLAWARACGKPAAVYGNSAGPIRTRTGRWLTPRVLNLVPLLMVRDHRSADLLRRLGVRRPLEVTADPVLLAERQDPEWGRSLLAAAGCPVDRPIIAVSVRPFGDGGHVARIAAAVKRLTAELGVQAVLFPVQATWDLPVCHEVARRVGPAAYVLDESTGPDELMAVLACTELVVGMRLHSLIFAVAQGVPAAGISYDPKVHGFLEEAGMPLVAEADHVDPDDLVRRVTAAWGDLPRLRRELEARRPALVAGAERNAQLALQLLDGRRS